MRTSFLCVRFERKGYSIIEGKESTNRKPKKKKDKKEHVNKNNIHSREK